MGQATISSSGTLTMDVLQKAMQDMLDADPVMRLTRGRPCRLETCQYLTEPHDIVVIDGTRFPEWMGKDRGYTVLVSQAVRDYQADHVVTDQALMAAALEMCERMRKNEDRAIVGGWTALLPKDLPILKAEQLATGC